MSFYAVARGHKTGVFNTWAECSAQIGGFKGAAFKKFATEDLALAFIRESAGDIGSVADEVLIKTESGIPKNESAVRLRKKNCGASDKAEEDMSANSLASPVFLRRLQALRGSVQQIGLRLNSFVDQTQRELKDIGDQIDVLLCEASGEGEVKDEVKDEEGPSRAKQKRKTVPDPFVASTLVDDLRAKGFEVDSDGFVSVFTDGACESNGRIGARGGIGVWWNHGHYLNTSAPLSVSSTRPPTNNRAEIEAATVAVAQARANGITRLNIKTDSQFLINCVTSWMKAWRAKGWRTAANEPVKNREELEALDRQLKVKESELVVRWTHVRGHAGVVGNEMADQLARKGARES